MKTRDTVGVRYGDPVTEHKTTISLNVFTNIFHDRHEFLSSNLNKRLNNAFPFPLPQLSVTDCQVLQQRGHRTMRPKHVPFLLLPALLVLQATRSDAQSPTESGTPTPTPEATGTKYEDRIRSVNTTSPVSTALRQNETAKELLLPTYDFVDAIADLTAKRRREKHPLACNLDSQSDWATRSVTRMLVHQVGNISNSTCYSSVDAATGIADGDLQDSFLANAFKTLRDGRLAMFHAAARMPLPRNGNWTDPGAPFTLLSRVHDRGAQTCSMEQMHAFRKAGKWFVRAAMTNHALFRFMPAWHRHILYEWVPRDFSSSLTMDIRRLSDEEFETSTTVVAMWPGRGVTIRDNNFEDADSPIAQAYQQNIVTADLAADAVTPSNIAILALPLAMNLIPIAFIADLNSIGMLLYILMTDLFSVIPFLIKGVELYQSSTPKQPVVVALFSGDESDSELRVWSVECTPQRHFRTAGIAFIVISVLALIGGISLEIWANNYMTGKRRRSQRVQERIPGPFGQVFMDTTTKGLLGTRETAIEQEYLRESAWWEEQYVQMSHANRPPASAAPSGLDHFDGGTATPGSQPSSWSTRHWPRLSGASSTR